MPRLPARLTIRAITAAAVAAGFSIAVVRAQPAPPPQGGGKAADGPVPADAGITITTSKQFRLLGSNIQVRRGFAALAEQTRESYRKLLVRDDSVVIPITIQFFDPAKVAASKASVIDEVTAVGPTVRLAINVRLDDGATPDVFRMAVIRCLLVADIIRGRNPEEIRPGNLVPVWLEHGVATAMAFREDPTQATVASMVFGRGRAFSVEKLLRESPDKLPSGSRAAYDASACGLVLTLLGMENGPVRFQRLLADFGSFEADPAAQIRHHFQEMAESNRALDKWWAMQVAQMSRPGATAFMDGMESDRRLAQTMLAEVPANPKTGEPPQTLSLADVIALPDKAIRDRLLKDTWLRLRALGPRIHPLFRPVTDAHRHLLEDVMGGKAGDVQARLAALDAERATLAARLDAIDDYLNWWEVTRGSGAAADLDRYREAVKVRPRDAAAEDPIGVYLDDVQKLVRKR